MNRIVRLDQDLVLDGQTVPRGVLDVRFQPSDLCPSLVIVGDIRPGDPCPGRWGVHVLDTSLHRTLLGLPLAS